MKNVENALVDFLSWLDKTDTITSPQKYNFLTHVQQFGLDQKARMFIRQTLTRAESIAKAELHQLAAKQQVLTNARRLHLPWRTHHYNKTVQGLETRVQQYRTDFQELKTKDLQIEESERVEADISEVAKLKAKFA